MRAFGGAGAAAETKQQVQSSLVVGLRDRVAIIRALNFSSPQQAYSSQIYKK